MRRLDRTKNAGFSLVELIIAIAILAIVGISISTLMMTSTNQYSEQNSEVQLQASAQLLKNQLQTYVVNANLGVYFENSNTASPEFLGSLEGAQACLVALGSEKKTDTDNKEVTAYHAGFIVWFGADGGSAGTAYANSVYYNEFDVSVEDSKVTYPKEDISNIASSWALLSQNVTGFYVEMNKDKAIVNTSITMENGPASYATTYAVALRNTDSELADATTIRKDTTYDWSTDAQATSVSVTPSSVTLSPGVSQSFSAAISGIGYPSQEVTWTMEGSPSDPTTVINESTGVLTIGPSETATSLKVIATNTDKEATLTGTAVVSIAQYSSFKITATNLTSTDGSVLSGTTILFSAELVGENMTQTSTPAWTAIADDGTTITCIGSGATCTVALPTAMKVGTVITVTAEATLGGKSITGTYTLKISDDSDAAVVLTASKTTLNRGGSVSFTPSVANMNDSSQYTIAYSIYSYGGLDQGQVSLSGSTLSANASISYVKSYTVTVQAVATITATGQQIKGSASVKIPAVSVVPETSAVQFTSETTIASDLKKKGLNYVGTTGVSTVSVPYTITGIEGGSVSFTTSPATSQVSVYDSGGSIVIGTATPFTQGSTWTVNMTVNGISGTTTTITVRMSDS